MAAVGFRRRELLLRHRPLTLCKTMRERLGVLGKTLWWLSCASVLAACQAGSISGTPRADISPPSATSTEATPATTATAALPPRLSVTAAIPTPPSESALLPAISVFRLPPPLPFLELCPAAASAAPRTASACSINAIDYGGISTALARAEQFSQVAVADRANDYALVIASLIRNTDSGSEIQFLTDLYWRSQHLLRVTYVHPAHPTGIATPPAMLPGANLPTPTDPEVLDGYAQHLAGALRRAKAFSSPYLHRALQSSNYATQLLGPSELSNFRAAGLQILHNPVYGAALRYEHDFYDNAYLDVFVYPVLSHDYHNNALLDQEIQALRGDLEHLAGQSQWRELRLGPITPLTVAAKPLRALSLSGTYRTETDAWLATSAHIFVLGDKFIKIRATHPKFAPVASDIDAFVAALPDRLTIPPQSPFMQRLRRDWQREASAAKTASVRGGSVSR